MRGRLPEAAFIILAVLFAVWGYRTPADPTSAFVLRDKPDHLMRVVTWNIGQAGGESASQESIGHVSTVLQSLNADMILLQEVPGANSAGRLRNSLGGHWHLETSEQAGRIVVTFSEQRSLVRHAGRFQSNAGLFCSYGLQDGRLIAVMNLHANAYSARRRNRQIGRSAEILLQTENHAAFAGILAGDLNLDIDLDKRRDLFTDNEHLDVETYNAIVANYRDAAVNAGSTAEPDRRLDYIFYSPGKLNSIQAGPFKGQRFGAMDHDPVVADFKIMD